MLARRLLQAGVPIVQAAMGIVQTWDTHVDNWGRLKNTLLPELDRGLAALMDDLSSSGLLDQTLVLVMGEFGRTPRINGKAGRDHWERCYSGLVAGGGLKCGQVVGASDALGERPAARPMHPGDLAMTLYGQLGIGTTQLTAVGLAPPGEVVEELL